MLFSHGLPHSHLKCSKWNSTADLETIDQNLAAITLAKLQNPVKQGFDRLNDDLKKVHQGLNKYGKSLDKVRRIYLYQYF